MFLWVLDFVWFQYKTNIGNNISIKNPWPKTSKVFYLLKLYAHWSYFWLSWPNQYGVTSRLGRSGLTNSSLYILREPDVMVHNWLYFYINFHQKQNHIWTSKLASDSYKPYLYSRIPNSSTQLFNMRIHMMHSDRRVVCQDWFIGIIYGVLSFAVKKRPHVDILANTTLFYSVPSSSIR